MKGRGTGDLFGSGSPSDRPSAPGDDLSPEPLPPDTIGVAALARRIQYALKDAFPRRFWLVGEASELERAHARRSKHWFFRLIEEDPNDGKTYALGAVLWVSEVRRLFGRGGVLEGIIEPKDGIQIRALCDVDFYPPNGDLRLVVRDIDPAFTLGRLALERRRLIERLTAEGVLERQRRLTVPPVPLRIGLITAENSAAYRDFVAEILQSGLAFRIFHLDARMQGEETVRTVLDGLATFDRVGVDVICLIRGGGAAVDLAWFDAEEIVRAISAGRTPVWCGIGHEIDSSVADLAANQAFKTPTAVAAALVERARSAIRSLEEAAGRLIRVMSKVQAERERLQNARRRAVRAGDALVRSAERELRADVRRFEGRVTYALTVPTSAVRTLSARLFAVPARSIVRTEEQALRRWSDAARAAVGRRLERGRERVESCDARARLLDPANVLKRGFAVLRDARGAVLKDAASVAVGRKVVVELRDGRVKARVESAEPDGSEARSDGDTQGGDEERDSRQLEIW